MIEYTPLESVIAILFPSTMTSASPTPAPTPSMTLPATVNPASWNAPETSKVPCETVAVTEAGLMSTFEPAPVAGLRRYRPGGTSAKDTAPEPSLTDVHHASPPCGGDAHWRLAGRGEGDAGESEKVTPATGDLSLLTAAMMPYPSTPNVSGA